MANDVNHGRWSAPVMHIPYLSQNSPVAACSSAVQPMVDVLVLDVTVAISGGHPERRN